MASLPSQHIFWEIKVVLASALLLVLSIYLLVSQIYAQSGNFSSFPGHSYFTKVGNGPHNVWFVLGWAVATLLIGFIRSYVTGNLYKLTMCTPRGYSRLPRTEVEAPSTEGQSRQSAPQRTFSYPDTLVFNFFDPDALPKPVQLYAEHIFSAVQALSAEIGFQVSGGLCDETVPVFYVTSADLYICVCCYRSITPATRPSTCS